jgi:hypothetical protein
MRTKMFAAALAVLANFSLPASAEAPPRLRTVGTYESSLFNVGGAEIPTFDPLTRRAFVVNARSATVDVLDLRNPASPTKIGSLDIVADLAPRSIGSANRVAPAGRCRTWSPSPTTAGSCSPPTRVSPMRATQMTRKAP